MSVIRANQRGSLILEVIVAVGVFALFSVAIGGIIVANARVVTSTSLETRAVALTREAMEQVIAIKQNTWIGVALTSPNSYYTLTTVAVPTPHYVMAPDPTATGELIEGFTRTIVMTAGMRDDALKLADSGTHVDPNVRKVTVTVKWNDRGRDRTETLVMYLTNWKGE